MENPSGHSIDFIRAQKWALQWLHILLLISLSKCVSCFLNWFFHLLMMLFPVSDFVATLVICSVKLHSPVFACSGFSIEGFLITFGWISALGTLMGLCVSGKFSGMYRRAGPSNFVLISFDFICLLLGSYEVTDFKGHCTKDLLGELLTCFFGRTGNSSVFLSRQKFLMNSLIFLS